jgi:hypothetical protein
MDVFIVYVYLLKLLIERETISEIKVGIRTKKYKLNAQDTGYRGPRIHGSAGDETETAYTRRVALVDHDGSTNREGVG